MIAAGGKPLPVSRHCNPAPMMAVMRYEPPPELCAAGRRFGVPDMLLVPGFLPQRQADALLALLLADGSWQAERITLFGRERVAPRLLAWYGEADASYRYSGVDRPAAGWPPCLALLARRTGAAVGWRFNYVLATRYRHGGDRLGWHADDERDLGPAPVIASLSLGATRTLRVRPRRGGASVGRALTHGSLVLMWGASQRDYKHAVPGTARPVGERLNLSFRLVGAERRRAVPR